MVRKVDVEYLIIGSGMVGLSIANQLLERGFSKNIACLDKEEKIGMHSSGRNSGVLHAGIYYDPASLKAKVCVKGSRRLKKWVEERKLSINPCGKVVVPQRPELDDQLELLASRGEKNGAKVEFWNKTQLSDYMPEAYTSSGRALWSPNTCVVNPIEVLNRLYEELKNGGVKFFNKKDFETNNYFIDSNSSVVSLGNNLKIKYDYLINCAGLGADKLAHKFNVGLNYKIMPFKGLYWELKSPDKFNIKSNLYPVPDLNVPFLGVHFTPSAGKYSKVTIGPTATFAFGRENYKGIKNIEIISSLTNFKDIFTLYLTNKGGFRKYVNEQSLLSIQPFFIKAAKELVPKIKIKDIKISNKVGIRSQLFNLKTHKLENDFICEKNQNTTHVLNAISPAFTASFELADYIIDNYIV